MKEKGKRKRRKRRYKKAKKWQRLYSICCCWPLHFCSEALPLIPWNLSVIKAECFGVLCQEVYEAPNGNVLRPCILVIEITLHNDVFMILDLSLTAGAVGQRIRKKPLSVFTYGCMSGGHVSEPGAQGVRAFYEWEPWASISIRTFSLSSSKSKKSWPLFQLLGKASCHSFKMLSRSFFLRHFETYILTIVVKFIPLPILVLVTICDTMTYTAHMMHTCIY